MTFTPSDTTNYASTTGSVTVQVNPASLTITWPSASAITHGQALSASTLSGGSAMSGNTVVTGTFAFASPTTVPTAGTQSPQSTIGIAPASINFGTLYLGSIVTKTVTVTNTGTRGLEDCDMPSLTFSHKYGSLGE